MTPILRRCAGPCGRDLPTNRFPRYTCRKAGGGKPNGHVYGQRCFACGSREPRTGAALDHLIDVVYQVYCEWRPGVPLTDWELAHLLGTSRTTVQTITSTALRKCLQRAKLLRITRETLES